MYSFFTVKAGKRLRVLGYRTALLLTILLFASCSHQSVMVQGWNRVEARQAYQVQKQQPQGAALTAPETLATAHAGLPKALPQPNRPVKAGKAAPAFIPALKQVGRQLAPHTPQRIPQLASATRRLQKKTDKDNSDLKAAVLFILVGAILLLFINYLKAAVALGTMVTNIFMLVAAILLVVGLLLLVVWLLKQ